jgi:hypothetical protein
MRSVNDEEGRRKREEGRRKKEEGRRKKEEGPSAKLSGQKEGRRKNKECLNFRLPIPDALFGRCPLWPMPDAGCPMPDARCPMPDAQFSNSPVIFIR